MLIFDVCHMLKLIRNLLGDKKVIYADTNGNLMPIKWQYIEELNNVQQDLGFTLGNKLKKKHIAWTKFCIGGRVTKCFTVNLFFKIQTI